MMQLRLSHCSGFWQQLLCGPLTITQDVHTWPSVIASGFGLIAQAASDTATCQFIGFPNYVGKALNSLPAMARAGLCCDPAQPRRVGEDKRDEPID
jgi:hypothetical protein